MGCTINGVGEEIHQYLFSVQKNRKQVNFPVKLKSTKTKFRREITCLTLMILNYYLIYKTKNIVLEENAVELKVYKGKMAKFITAKLTFTPSHCKRCGIENKNYTVYKNGTKTSRITLPITGTHPTYLNLKKQRFFCKACNSTFSASSKIVDDHCFISNQTKAKVLLKSTDAQSLTDISKACF